MTKRVVMLLLAAATVMSALMLPAAANAGNGHCPDGSFCIWRHAHYNGARYAEDGSRRNLTGVKFPGTNIPVANQGSSLVNAGLHAARDDVRVYYWGRPGKNSPSLCIPRLGRIIDLTSYRIIGVGESSWNDNIAGFRWVAGC